MSQTVAVLDYGMGNLHSAAKALEKVGENTRVKICADAKDVLAADRVVFPGVGAMRDCMAGLRARGFDQTILEVITRGKPVLGICVGMQAMMAHSDENQGVDGLGVFEGRVEKFPSDMRDAMLMPLKVPHMGWNQVQQVSHALWDGIPDFSRFYFVHSFRTPVLEEKQVAGRCEYGRPFVAACARANVFAVQFHPEKSSTHGLKLLANFLSWKP